MGCSAGSIAVIAKRCSAVKDAMQCGHRQVIPRSRQTSDDLLHFLEIGSHRLSHAHLAARRCTDSRSEISQAECGLHT